MFPQFTPRSISARLRLNPEEEEERKRGIADLNKMLQEMGARQPILENGGARPFSPRPKLQENEAQSEDDMQPMLRSGSVRAFSHLPERQDEEDTHAEDDMQPMPRSGGVRAFSHLPERQDEEDTHAEDDMQPMPRSGGVRAFSHLPERRAGRDEDTAADTGSPGSFTPPVRRELDDEDSHGSSLPDEAARPAKTMPGIFAEHEPPQNTRGSFSSGSPAADPDAAPETQPLDDHDPMLGMPWDSRPPEASTRTATSRPPGSRWLQKLLPPGARAAQAAQDARQAQQQPGMQPFQASAPAQQKPGGAGPTSPTPQAPGQVQPAAPQNAADAQKKPQTEPAPQASKAVPQYADDLTAKDKEIEDLKKATPSPSQEIEKQRKYVQQLENARKPSKPQIDQAKARLDKLRDPQTAGVAQARKERAIISRKKESVELAAQLINSTRNPGEPMIDPSSIDENSPEYRDRVLEALCRLHGGTAPWMDHLADTFGENERMKDESANPKIKTFINNVDPTNVPWCGSAAAAAMKRSGIKPPTGAASSSAWRQWGEPGTPSRPNVGDVYYIDYDGGGSGHISTVVGVSKDGTQVFCLGGNQNDGLNISAYPIKDFGSDNKKAKVYFRRPPGQKNNIPAPTFDYNADISNFGILSGLTR